MYCILGVWPSCILNASYYLCFMQFLLRVFKCAFQFMFFSFLFKIPALQTACHKTTRSRETASLRNVTVNVLVYIGVHMCIHVTILYIYCI